MWIFACKISKDDYIGILYPTKVLRFDTSAIPIVAPIEKIILAATNVR